MKFDVICADPPWYYRERKVVGRFGLGVHGQYPTMKTEEIAALPVAHVAADPSALLLWSTFPHLPDALQVIEGWGFKYSTLGFVWIKLNRGRANESLLELAHQVMRFGLDKFLARLAFFGTGFYAKANAEVCLLATRTTGRVLRPVTNKVSSVVFAPRGRHSTKPDAVYRRAVRLFGPGRTYVELFAREPRPGWRVLGNEVDGLNMADALTKVAGHDMMAAEQNEEAIS